jgi:hypothetical protein
MGRWIPRDPDVIDLIDGDSGCVKAILNGKGREPGTMLAPIEPLLFGRGHKLAIPNNRRRRIPMVRIYP